MYRPAAKLGLRLSGISIVAPLLSAFAFQPSLFPSRHLSGHHFFTTTNMVTSSPSVFPSTRDARAFVAESVSAKSDDDITKCGELACQRNSFQTTLGGTKPLAYAVYEETEQTTRKKKNGGKNTKKKGGSADDAGNSALSGPQLLLALSVILNVFVLER